MLFAHFLKPLPFRDVLINLATNKGMGASIRMCAKVLLRVACIATPRPRPQSLFPVFATRTQNEATATPKLWHFPGPDKQAYTHIYAGHSLGAWSLRAIYLFGPISGSSPTTKQTN